MTINARCNWPHKINALSVISVVSCACDFVRSASLDSAPGIGVRNRVIVVHLWSFYLSEERGNNNGVLADLLKTRSSVFVHQLFRPSKSAPLTTSYAAYTSRHMSVCSHNALRPPHSTLFYTGRIKLNRSSCRYNEEHSPNPLAPLMTRPTDKFSAFSLPMLEM